MKKKKKMCKSRENVCMGILFLFYLFFFFFLPSNSTFLHISYPGRQMTKGRDLNFFLIGKLTKFLIHRCIAYLLLIREDG